MFTPGDRREVFGLQFNVLCQWLVVMMVNDPALGCVPAALERTLASDYHAYYTSWDLGYTDLHSAHCPFDMCYEHSCVIHLRGHTLGLCDIYAWNNLLVL